MSRCVVALALMMYLTGTAAAQSTRPAPPGWTQAVSDFSEAISVPDSARARALLSVQPVIRTFDSPRGGNLNKLIEFAGGQTFLNAHAYLHPPVTLAGDLAADVAASAAIPEDAKKALAMDDTNKDKAATIAVKWIAAVLSADEGTPVGVIALWNPNAKTDDVPHLLFILLKGTQNDAGKYVITLAVYGDPF